MRLKRYATNLAILFASLVACFLLGEVCVRLFGHSQIHSEPDPQFGYRGRRNFGGIYYFVEDGRNLSLPFKTNSEGFRDRERKRVKPSGIRRVVMVGDSFLAGFQVPYETLLHERVQKLLDARRAQIGPVEVMNFSAIGYSTSLEYLLLKNYGMRFAPDLVVLCFFQNDPTDCSMKFNVASTPYFVQEKGGGLTLLPPRSVRHERRRGLLSFTLNRYSEFYVWQKKRTAVIQQRVKNYFRKREGRFPSLYQVFLKPVPVGVNEAWSLCRRVFVEMSVLCREKRVPLLVVNLPCHEQVSQKARLSLVQRYPGLKGKALDWERPERELSVLAEKCRFRYFSLVPAFRKAHAAVPEGKFYFNGDPHFTAKGHEVAARALAPVIEAALGPRSRQASDSLLPSFPIRAVKER